MCSQMNPFLSRLVLVMMFITEMVNKLICMLIWYCTLIQLSERKQILLVILTNPIKYSTKILNLIQAAPLQASSQKIWDPQDFSYQRAVYDVVRLLADYYPDARGGIITGMRFSHIFTSLFSVDSCIHSY